MPIAKDGSVSAISLLDKPRYKDHTSSAKHALEWIPMGMFSNCPIVQALLYLKAVFSSELLPEK